MPSGARPKRKPRHNEFDEMVPGRCELMEPVRCEMQIAAERIRNRLRLVVIIKAGEITPAWIAPQFDETGADHNAEAEPAKKPEDKERRTALRKWLAINQRTEKDRQETGFEQLNFPAVTVLNLSNVNDRHVHHPKNHKVYSVRVATDNNDQESEAHHGIDR